MIYSIESEQAVIGGLLCDPTRFDQMAEMLSADDFFKSEHREIFGAMGQLLRSGEPMDCLTLIDALGQRGERAGGLGYLMDIAQNTPSAANIRSYAKIVLDKSRRRQIYTAMTQFAEMAISSDDPLEQIAAMAAAQIGNLQSKNRLTLVCNTDEVLSEVIKNIDKRLNDPGLIDGIPTGLTALDDRYFGWKPGDLIILAGRPSMGKSALGFQIAQHNAMAGRKVMAFSLEMTAEKIIERGLANAGRIDLGQMRNPKSAREEFWPRLSAAVGKLKGMPLVIDETPGLHIHQICARARAEHRKSKVSLVVVDHIHLAAGDGQSREREISSITGGLKALGKELGCPVLALCQLNRKCEDRPNKRPQLADLRDSGSIEQDADIVMFAYRDEYYNKDTQNPGVIEVGTAKFREGEVGIDYLSCKLSMSMISDIAPGYAPQEETKSKFEY